MKITAVSRLSASALAAALFLGTPLTASAGLLRINFGPAQSFGEDWTGAGDNVVDVVADDSVYESLLAPGGLPFSIGDAGPSFAGSSVPNPFAAGLNIGGTTYTSFCVSSDGVIGLGSATRDCTLDPGYSPIFSVLQGAWNYTPDPEASTPAAVEGSVSVTLGLVDRVFDQDTDPYNLAEAVPALRFFWNGMVDGPAPPVGSFGGMRFQAVFFDLGGGDFDVEFNYGSPYDTGIQRITMPDGLEGFDDLFFGVDDDRLAGTSSDPYFTFRDGVFGLSTTTTEPPPTTVPEPGALLLLSTGAILLLVRRRSTALRAAR